MFTCADPASTVLRLASLMDGLAVQVALRDPEIPVARMTELWLTSAALELGIAVEDLMPKAEPASR